jgi:hypothetical protein
MPEDLSHLWFPRTHSWLPSNHQRAVETGMPKVGCPRLGLLWRVRGGWGVRVLKLPQVSPLSWLGAPPPSASHLSLLGWKCGTHPP